MSAGEGRSETSPRVPTYTSPPLGADASLSVPLPCFSCRLLLLFISPADFFLPFLPLYPFHRSLSLFSKSVHHPTGLDLHAQSGGNDMTSTHRLPLLGFNMRAVAAALAPAAEGWKSNVLGEKTFERRERCTVFKGHHTINDSVSL